MSRQLLLGTMVGPLMLTVLTVQAAAATPVGPRGSASAAALAGADPTIAAAGDIGCGSSDPNYNGGNGTAAACRQKYTSDLLVNGGYTSVLTLGDNMQSDPSPTGFATVFNSTWGRVKPVIHPEAGNHDYGYSGAKGYFGAAAGDPAEGYYSFDLGRWHVVALNSNCAKSPVAASRAEHKSCGCAPTSPPTLVSASSPSIITLAIPAATTATTRS